LAPTACWSNVTVSLIRHNVTLVGALSDPYATMLANLAVSLAHLGYID
jgi:hypothetical protein